MSKKEPKRVLVVEDEEELNSAYCLILSAEGYDVSNAFDGNDGLDQLEKANPDLILLDLRMPNLDGVGFLRAANIPETYPQTKVVVFTNFDVNEEIKEAFELGAHRYVLKANVSPSELVKLVSEELEEEPADL
jgi:DNA-binding response OmpR family regulator